MDFGYADSTVITTWSNRYKEGVETQASDTASIKPYLVSFTCFADNAATLPKHAKNWRWFHVFRCVAQPQIPKAWLYLARGALRRTQEPVSLALRARKKRRTYVQALRWRTA